MPAFLGLAAVSFVLMEPVTYAVHRWVMHGPGLTLHHSHHRPPLGRLEANDLFPVAFASLVGVALAVGFNVPGYAWLVPVGTGVTLYGLAYGLVHDGVIHARLPAVASPLPPVPAITGRRPPRAPSLRWRALRDAGPVRARTVAVTGGSHRSSAARPAGPVERVDAVPGADAPVGPETGEELLPVPTVEPGAPDGVDVPRGGVGEGAGVGDVPPQAERGLATDAAPRPCRRRPAGPARPRPRR